MKGGKGVFYQKKNMSRQGGKNFRLIEKSRLAENVLPSFPFSLDDSFFSDFF